MNKKVTKLAATFKIEEATKASVSFISNLENFSNQGDVLKKLIQSYAKDEKFSKKLSEYMQKHGLFLEEIQKIALHEITSTANNYEQFKEECIEGFLEQHGLEATDVSNNTKSETNSLTPDDIYDSYSADYKVFLSDSIFKQVKDKLDTYIQKKTDQELTFDMFELYYADIVQDIRRECEFIHNVAEKELESVIIYLIMALLKSRHQYQEKLAIYDLNAVGQIRNTLDQFGMNSWYIVQKLRVEYNETFNNKFREINETITFVENYLNVVTDPIFTMVDLEALLQQLYNLLKMNK